ncbi:Uncharacterised protein [uncultured archaeon]|nr:Uncharacterised protein [uncultured archaeon]
MERSKFKDMEIIKLVVSKEYYTPSELNDWDFERFHNLGTKRLYYWYSDGDYCGDGLALVLVDGLWYTHGMSHCSCNGPTEDVSFSPSEGKKSPADFFPMYEEAEVSDELAPLVKEAMQDLSTETL